VQQVSLGALFDEDGESLSNVNTVLDQYGVALREVDGTFRDTSNVLDDLSKKWGTFNSAQKSEISTVIAGFKNSLIARMYGNIQTHSIIKCLKLPKSVKAKSIQIC
jgi:hypothetical protein